MMNNLLFASFFLLAGGIFTSVTVLGGQQVLLIAPACYFIFRAYNSGELKFSKSSWFLVGFFLISLFSLILNLSDLAKPAKNFGQLRYLLAGVLSVLAFDHFIKITNKKRQAFLVHTFLFSILGVGLICLYQKIFLHQPRAKSLTDTLRYGYGMGMILPVLLGVMLRPQLFKMVNRKLLFASFVFGLCGLYVSFTRGALLGFICAVPFVLIYWKKKAGIIAFVCSGLLVGALGGFYLFGKGEIGNRYISSMNNKSDSMRRSQWESAYLGWKERPVIGLGYSNFINHCIELKQKYSLSHQDYKGHAHNVFLEILVGTGVLGLLFFLGWFFFWFHEMYKSSTELAGLVIPFMVAFFVSGQFEVVLDANNATMIFAFYALSMACKKQESLI